MTVYTVNMVPVSAVAIIVYEINSRSRDTRAAFKSRKGEEGSLFWFVAATFRPAASTLDRAEWRVCMLRFVWEVAVLCEETAFAMGSGVDG